MAEQPFLFGDGPWIQIKDGSPTGMSIFKRHYTARARRKIVGNRQSEARLREFERKLDNL